MSTLRHLEEYQLAQANISQGDMLSTNITSLMLERCMIAQHAKKRCMGIKRIECKFYQVLL